MSKQTSSNASDHSATDRVAQVAHSAVNTAAANLANAESSLREAQKAAGVKIEDVSEQAQQFSAESMSALKDYVKQNPIESVGIALATGYLFSLLMRKS